MHYFDRCYIGMRSSINYQLAALVYNDSLIMSTSDQVVKWQKRVTNLKFYSFWPTQFVREQFFFPWIWATRKYVSTRSLVSFHGNIITGNQYSAPIRFLNGLDVMCFLLYHIEELMVPSIIAISCGWYRCIYIAWNVHMWPAPTKPGTRVICDIFKF